MSYRHMVDHGHPNRRALLEDTGRLMGRRLEARVAVEHRAFSDRAGDEIVVDILVPDFVPSMRRLVVRIDGDDIRRDGIGAMGPQSSAMRPLLELVDNEREARRWSAVDL